MRFKHIFLASAACAMLAAPALASRGAATGTPTAIQMVGRNVGVTFVDATGKKKPTTGNYEIAKDALFDSSGARIGTSIVSCTILDAGGDAVLLQRLQSAQGRRHHPCGPVLDPVQVVSPRDRGGHGRVRGRPRLGARHVARREVHEASHHGHVRPGKGGLMNWILRIAAVVAVAGTAAVPAPAAAGGTPVVEGRFDVGGYKLYLLCEGTGSPTVVYFHGASESGNGGALNIGRVQAAVAKKRRICSYDRANLGRSDRVPGPIGGAQLTRDVHALLARAGVKPPYVLLGASFGGLVAYAYTVTYPNDVKGMLLLDAAFPTEATLDPILPQSERFKHADWRTGAEKIDQLDVYQYALKHRSRQPAIPVVYLLATPQTWTTGEPQDAAYDVAVLKTQAAYVHQLLTRHPQAGTEPALHGRSGSGADRTSSSTSSLPATADVAAQRRKERASDQRARDAVRVPRPHAGLHCACPAPRRRESTSSPNAFASVRQGPPRRRTPTSYVFA